MAIDADSIKTVIRVCFSLQRVQRIGHLYPSLCYPAILALMTVACSPVVVRV